MAKTGKKAIKKKKATKTKSKSTQKNPKTPARSAKKRKRYTAKEKKTILEKYNALRESGTNAYDAAKKVGISYITIRSWEKKQGIGRKTKPPKSSKTSITAFRSSQGLSMLLPNGNRIEGLTVDQVIKIVKSI